MLERFVPPSPTFDHLLTSQDRCLSLSVNVLDLSGLEEFHVYDLCQDALVPLSHGRKKQRDLNTGYKLTGPTNVFLLPENHMITMIKAQPATTTET